MGVVEFLDREYKRVFKDYENDEMQLMMYNNLKEVLEVIAKQGHSGFSMNYFRNQLNLLLQYKPLGEITFNDEDFKEKDFGDMRQHKVNGAYFLNDDGSVNTVDDCYFYCKTILRPDFTYEELEYPDTYQGSGLKLIYKDGKILCGRLKGVVRDITTHKSIEKPYKIDTIQIEYPKDWWITIVDGKSLEEYEKEFIIEYEPLLTFLDKEVYGFKDGKYTGDILKAIDKVIEDKFR